MMEARIAMFPQANGFLPGSSRPVISCIIMTPITRKQANRVGLKEPLFAAKVLNSNKCLQHITRYDEHLLECVSATKKNALRHQEDINAL
jgi:hypothetical protein